MTGAGFCVINSHKVKVLSALVKGEVGVEPRKEVGIDL